MYYMYIKIMEIMIPCTSNKRSSVVETHQHPRLRRLRTKRTITTTLHRLKTIEADSFTNSGPKLFNYLPRRVRDFAGAA